MKTWEQRPKLTQLLTVKNWNDAQTELLTFLEKPEDLVIWAQSTKCNLSYFQRGTYRNRLSKEDKAALVSFSQELQADNHPHYQWLCLKESPLCLASKVWVQILTHYLTTCITLDKLLHLSELPCLYLRVLMKTNWENTGLPWWLSGKESACQCKRHGSTSGSGRSPRRKWQLTPVFLPGEFHGQRSLTGYSPWGHKRVRHDLVTKQQQQQQWDNIHKSCSVNWNRLHRCWLSLLAGLTWWNSNYYLRKWPICIATWIFTVNDFDWDSNVLTAGSFHSLKIQLV